MFCFYLEDIKKKIPLSALRIEISFVFFLPAPPPPHSIPLKDHQGRTQGIDATSTFPLHCSQKVNDLLLTPFSVLKETFSFLTVMRLKKRRKKNLCLRNNSLSFFTLKVKGPDDKFLFLVLHLSVEFYLILLLILFTPYCFSLFCSSPSGTD